jgi:hypothetical protein
VTSSQYRAAVAEMSPQRQALVEEIYKGGQADVEPMVLTFEKYPDVEPLAVFWFKRHMPGLGAETEHDRVKRATIDAAEYAKHSYKISVASMILAVVAIIIGLIALAK